MGVVHSIKLLKPTSLSRFVYMDSFAIFSGTFPFGFTSACMVSCAVMPFLNLISAISIISCCEAGQGQLSQDQRR